MDARGLGDLPAGCLSCILRSLSPREVYRLALVSSEFLDASRSDAVWEGLLPPRWRDVIADLDGALRMRLLDVYAKLCAGIFVGDDKNKLYWIDRPTGGICNMISARGLVIIWGDDRRYWEWRAMKGSRFDKVAVLKNVCWLEVRGEFSGHLSRGSYTVSFRLRYPDGVEEVNNEDRDDEGDEGEENHEDRDDEGDENEENHEDRNDESDEGEENHEDMNDEDDEGEENHEDRNDEDSDEDRENDNQGLCWPWIDRHWRPSLGPVTFTLSTGDDHSQQESSRFLTAPGNLQDREMQAGIESLASARRVEHGWMEYDAGTFSVEDEDSTVSLEFSMKEIKGGNWKSGIAVDGAVIKPTFLATN